MNGCNTIEAMGLYDRYIILGIALLGTSAAFSGQKASTSTQQNVRIDANASAIVEGPAVVRAGEEASFTITLNEPPNFAGGIIEVEFESNGEPGYLNRVALTPGTKSFSLQMTIPIDTQPSTWVLKRITFSAGKDIRQDLTPSKRISFQILPAAELKYPTSAEVTVNLSQAQLLRTETIKIQHQIQALKALLQAQTRSDTGSLLNKSVQNALEALNSTEESFRKLGGGADLAAANVFFDDLRLSYHDAAATVAMTTTREGSFLIPATATPGDAYPPAAHAVLRSFEQNELAYTLVADTQKLVFDLDVESVPAGATVCYHRRNDPCHPHPKDTNSTIPSLPYAIWIVHFEKPGYKPEDREHDPFREYNHMVVVELKR